MTAADPRPAARAEAILALLAGELPQQDAALRARVDAIKAGVDLASAASVAGFGAGVASAIGRFADSVLDRAAIPEADGLGRRLTALRAAITAIDPQRDEGGGLMRRLAARAGLAAATLRDRFASARTRIDEVAAGVEDDLRALRLGLVTLDRLFEENRALLLDLSLHIIAGRELQAELAGGRMAAAEAALASAAEAARPLAAQALRDVREQADRLDRALLNLEKSRAICLAQLPAVRQTEATALTTIEELQMLLAQAIPAWKSTMVLYVEQDRQARAQEKLAAARDLTNAQLDAMAKALDRNAAGAMRESARGFVDVEAVTTTLASLTRSLDTLDRLQAEAAAARGMARKQLAAAEAAFIRQLGSRGR